MHDYVKFVLNSPTLSKEFLRRAEYRTRLAEDKTFQPKRAELPKLCVATVEAIRKAGAPLADKKATVFPFAQRQGLRQGDILEERLGNVEKAMAKLADRITRGLGCARDIAD